MKAEWEEARKGINGSATSPSSLPSDLGDGEIEAQRVQPLVEDLTALRGRTGNSNQVSLE